jgi:tRNA A-37 threonylcarbamoyl transferase component Bud32
VVLLSDKMKRYLKDNLTRIDADYKLYIANDLIGSEFEDICRNVEHMSFDWRQNSRYSRFARFDVDGQGYYIKKFENRDMTEPFKSLFKGSRVTRELRGNCLLIQNDVSAPSAAAMIEKKGGNYLITREILSRGTLLDFLLDESVPPRLHREAVVKMAQILAKLHGKHIILGDINMNNALVTVENGVKIHILDNERTRKVLSTAKGVLKNLVQLNKSGHKQITAADRVRFYKVYNGKRRLDAGDKEMIKLLVHKTRKRRGEL